MIVKALPLLLLLALFACASDSDRATNDGPDEDTVPTCAGVPIQWVGTETIYHPGSLSKPQTLLLITAFWCRACKKFEDSTLSDSVVAQIICESFNAIRIDPWDDSDVVYFDSALSCSLFAFDAYDIYAFPTTFVIDSSGELKTTILGNQKPDVFADTLRWLLGE